MSVYQDSTVCTNTASIARVHLQQLMQTVGLKTVVKSALLVFFARESKSKLVNFSEETLYLRPKYRKMILQKPGSTVM